MKFLLSIITVGALASAAELRIGIVGTDTSHCLHFVRILNDPASPEHVPGARIVAAFKGGSKDIESSYTRVDKHAAELHDKWNVEIVPSIAQLCKRADAVLLLSSDGRVHLPQAREIIAAKKPLFIDKPLASTLEDAREIASLAKAAGVPWFSSSGFRFGEIARKMKSPDTRGVIVWGPGSTEEHHYLDLGWYAIHPIELMYTLMGTGCEKVSRAATPESDEIVGVWKDGRIGTVRAMRPQGDYGAVVIGPKSVSQSAPKTPFSYRPLIAEIVRFMQTGKPPVTPEETLEIFSFLDAARRSKDQGGVPVSLR
jgi:predicted dehydrogenase